MARELVRAAVGKVFTKFLAGADLLSVVQWFETGGQLKLPEMGPAREILHQLEEIEGLLENTARLGGNDSSRRMNAAETVSAGEFILEGLWAHRRIGRSEERGYYAEKPRPAEQREPQGRPRRQFN